MTALHPVRQFVWHIRTRQPLPAPALLTPAEKALFDRMPPADQLEGLAVAETLTRWGYGGDRDLLAAGLLHDVGKSRAPAGLGWRVAMTVLESFGLAGAFGRVSPAVRALAAHAAAGAEMASSAGISADIVRLIGEHHTPASDDRQRALQRADSLH